MNKQLEMESRFSGNVRLELEISSYMDNGRLYIGLVEVDGECPELEGFIEKHGLGEFTGLVGNSGFGSYPLYLFNPEKLREAAPEDMECFERTVMGITPEKSTAKEQPETAR